MARKNGHTQLTRGFKPWKSKLKNPPRWRKFFPFPLPLSFCLRLSRAPALPSWNFPFTSGEGCAQNVAASNAALGGWPASNRNTLFKTTHCAVCFARREKKKKKEKFAIHFHHIPRPGPYSSSIVSTFAVHETILSLSLFLSFSPSLSLSVCSLPLLTIRVFAENRTGVPRSTVCVSIKRDGDVSSPRNHHDSAVNLPLRGSLPPFCQLDNPDSQGL